MMTDQDERKPEQPLLQTPVKSMIGFQKDMEMLESKKQSHQYRHNLIQFQPLAQSPLQNPKLKLMTKSKQYTVSYVYKVSSIDIVGNFEQSSNQKIRFNMSQDSPEQDPNLEKNCDLISEAKKKGIKDYTMYIRKKPPLKSLTQNNSSSVNTIGYAIGSQFFKISKLLNYFQVRVVEFNGDAPIAISIGVVNSQQALTSGKNCISMGFKFTAQGNFEIYRSNSKIEEDIGFKLKVGDVVGCGFVYHRNEVFFTHNGNFIYEKLKLHIPEMHEQKAPATSKLSLLDQVNQHNKKFYPYIALESTDLNLEAIFENAYQHFVFNYEEELQKMQAKFIETEMSKNLELSEESIYGLMRNYFKFYGHQKSSLAIEAEMMKRNMKFYPQNEPIRNKLQYTKKHEIMMNQIKKMEHPNKEKRIRKRQKMKSLTQSHRHQQSESSQREPDNDNIEISISGSDGQFIDEFYKLSRTGVPSDRPSLKDVEMDASISNEGSDSNNRNEQAGSYFINKKKMEKKVEQLKRSEEEKFKSERIQIMKHIQQGKIEQALKLFSKSFKMIFLKEKHIEVFFKAHIFLKIYDQDGLQKALEYAKAEHKIFSQYENYLMPYFNPKSTSDPSEPECQFRYIFHNMRPLREMLFLICLQNKHEMNLQRQLQIFANFVSTVVCEDAGFFGMSKLELVLNHYQIAEKKIMEYQIPIGGLDLENAQIV